MLQLACTLICSSLLQFILREKGARSGFDIIYESASSKLMRSMGFLENYRGSASERKKRESQERERDEECLNEDLQTQSIMNEGIFNLHTKNIS